MAENSSLLLTEAKLTDQRTFTCMVVAGADIPEYPVNVVIYSEYELEYHFSASLSARIQYVNTFFFFLYIAETPTDLTITDKAVELEIGKRTKVSF